MYRIRVAICAAAFAVVATAGLTGCINNEPEPVKSKVPSSAYTDVKQSGLPAGFPVPPGAKKGNITEANGRTAGQVTVKDAGDAYDFWVEQLPEKGYTITNKQNVEIGDAGGSFIEFKGNGYRSGKIAITDKKATVTLEKK
ncbi:MAG: hypothetical protein GEV07_15340 [Streptosporangiales bacterium]|nr:hypothetical protein [Streptosporangiales bacterium]